MVTLRIRPPNWLEYGSTSVPPPPSPSRNGARPRTLEEDFPLHVAVYRRVIAEFNGGTPFPLQLATQVDAPPGSGLGSSSALVVAMLLTTCALIGSSPGPYELARLAWEIERVDLGMAGGWQDHYAAAFGGFNFMESRPNGEVVVNPLRIRREVIAELEAFTSCPAASNISARCDPIIPPAPVIHTFMDPFFCTSAASPGCRRKSSPINNAMSSSETRTRLRPLTRSAPRHSK